MSPLSNSLLPAFPKFSVTRSYLKTLLTAQFKELLLPSPGSQTDTQECLDTFTRVLQLSRQASGYLVNDLNVGSDPHLPDILLH